MSRLKYILYFTGTIFLWLYWPSFNGGGAYGDEQHRAYLNTYLSLAACAVVTFAFSAFFDKKGKFSCVRNVCSLSDIFHKARTYIGSVKPKKS